MAYVETFRCTPLLVQIIWFYYALPVVLGHRYPGACRGDAGAVALYRRVLRRDLPRRDHLIERGPWDAARALGMRRWPLMRLVILPQAVRRMMPPFMNQSIIQLKNTSLVSHHRGRRPALPGQLITAATYRPLEVYTMVALIYFAVLFPLTLGAQWVEQRLAREDRPVNPGSSGFRSKGSRRST